MVYKKYPNLGGALTKTIARNLAVRSTLEQMLKEECANKKSNLSAMDEQGIEGSVASDPIRAAGIEVRMGLESKLVNLHTDRAREIVDALKRLDRGTYGICTDCRGTIPQARLKAAPSASRCRACQEEIESSTPTPVNVPVRFLQTT